MVQGAINFRDLGGLVVDSRTRVRTRHVYRSGSLHALTAHGIESLSELRIRAIVDLRSDGERASRPPRLPEDGSVAWLFHSPERHTGDLVAALQGAGASDGRALMLKIYRALPYDLLVPYRILLRRLIDDARPMAFNCAAGKDRTGVAAALILSALSLGDADLARLRERLLTPISQVRG